MHILIFKKKSIYCMASSLGVKNCHVLKLKSHLRFRYLFLHGNLLREAVWSCKITVETMRFTCCLNMAFNMKTPKLGPDLHTWRFTGKRCSHDWSFRQCFLSRNVARVYMTLWLCNDVRKFDADTNLFWEIKCKKRDIKCLSNVFSAVYAEIR